MAIVSGMLMLVGLTTRALGDTFGTGHNAIDIEFVTIGSPGNPPSELGNMLGAVDSIYRIGKHEISRQMIEKANAVGALEISLSDMSWIDGGSRPEMPATGVNWNEAARFVNWLNVSSGSVPAYKFVTEPGHAGYNSSSDIVPWGAGDVGFDSLNPFRNRHAKYFLPSIHEWYKAAYYDPVIGSYWYFPTGSDTAPVAVSSGTDPNTAVYDQPAQQGPADITQAGGLSPYGVMGMGGNVFEWQETTFDFLNQFPGYDRWQSGGNWSFSHVVSSGNDNPDDDHSTVGFRVASIPEPSTMLLGQLASLVALLGRRRWVNRD